MRVIWRTAWDRFNVITAIIGDVQGRVIATLFYFTILVPFALISRLFTDPLRRKVGGRTSFWEERAAIPTDLDSAKRQG